MRHMQPIKLLLTGSRGSGCCCGILNNLRLGTVDCHRDLDGRINNWQDISIDLDAIFSTLAPNQPHEPSTDQGGHNNENY